MLFARSLSRCGASLFVFGVGRSESLLLGKSGLGSERI